MELIRRLVDAKRMLLGQDVAATPAKPTQSDPSMPITWPRVAEHSLGLILTPVSPERARAILLAALSGDLWMQYDLFVRMEDSWDRLEKDLNEVRNAVKRLSWIVTPYSAGTNKPTDAAEEKAALDKSVASVRELVTILGVA